MESNIKVESELIEMGGYINFKISHYLMQLKMV